MILRSAAAMLVLLVSAPAFRYERPVEVSGDAAPETCVPLPVDLLAHAAPGLEDLRVMADGREVAYRVQTSGEAVDAAAVPEQILNLGERDGSVSFDVRMTQPRYNQVVLHLGRSHFSVLIRISGIDRPETAGTAFPEIAYSANADEDQPQQRTIRLPESSFPYLHFEIRTLALEPLTPQDIAGVDAVEETARPVRYVDVAAAGPPEQQGQQTICRFHVPANAPVERLVFAVAPDAVFSRNAVLARLRESSARDSNNAQISAEEEQTLPLTLTHSAWRSPGDASGDAGGTVDIAGLEPVPYPSTVELKIENGDDQPLDLQWVRLMMRERQVCFLRRSGVVYTLRYGDPALGAPVYDASPIQAAASTASISQLGAERALTPEAAAAGVPFTERHPILLWVALILVVGTLGVVALRSARG